MIRILFTIDRNKRCFWLAAPNGFMVFDKMPISKFKLAEFTG
jgi:hypothetical protein